MYLFLQSNNPNGRLGNDAKASKWVGTLLLIAGLLSIAAPFGAGLSITIMIGALLLMSGWTLIAVAGMIRKVTDAVQE